MDALVSAITTITGQVLRNIADAIDGTPPPSARVPVHIETLHVHMTEVPAPTASASAAAARSWVRRTVGKAIT